MLKSPTTIFTALMAHEGEAPAGDELRRSIEMLRSGRSLHAKSSTEDSSVEDDVRADEKVRGGFKASVALATDTKSQHPIAEDEDNPTPENVLKQRLGELYIEDGMLKNFCDIAEGGFATVQSAQMTLKNGASQVVAVKRLRPERLQNQESMLEFIAEANLWRKLKSTDVVKLMGVGAKETHSIQAIQQTFYIVCEFMEGGTLQSVVHRQEMTRKKDVYRSVDVFRWFIGIARAVKYLHGCRPAIIHRDMKLENVLLTTSDMSSNEAKILDLGLHIRGSAARTRDANGIHTEKSFYGGNLYDCIMTNGSIHGPAGPGQTLEDKVRLADATMPSLATISPPLTSTKHGSITDITDLTPIDEEKNPSGSSAEGSPMRQDGSGAAAAEADAAAAPAAAAPEAQSQQRMSLKHLVSGQTFGAIHRVSAHSDSSPSLKKGGGSFEDLVRVFPLQKRSRSTASFKSEGSMASRISREEMHTSGVGSWMYMAPEMYTSHKYTEKVDVFSMSVMLFEALRGRLNVTKLAITLDPESLQHYAERVAGGWREDIPSNWPPEVTRLLEDGWHQDADLRITAAEFLQRVSTLMTSDAPDLLDDAVRAAAYKGDCQGCCTIM